MFESQSGVQDFINFKDQKKVFDDKNKMHITVIIKLYSLLSFYKLEFSNYRAAIGIGTRFIY